MMILLATFLKYYRHNNYTKKHLMTNGDIMKKSMILIFTLILTTVSFSQTDLTIEKAIQIALQKNSALVKAKYNLESSKASVKSAYGQLLPNFGIRGGWSWSKIEDIFYFTPAPTTSYTKIW